ncbi:MAG: triose-phosphate isomerase family protein [Pseudomonadota bacterium]
MLVCNWKMFGNKALVDAYKNVLPTSPDIIVCPPFPLLVSLSEKFVIGAQNCHHEKEGAFTGEVSAYLLAEIGCRYVLLGHSERRQYAAETNALVIHKSNVAIDCGLIPIVCVGSQDEDVAMVKKALLSQLPSSKSAIIAYEPLWSIGTNRVPSLAHIQTITAFIQDQGFKTVVYGGSVNETNAKEISKVCNGLLIGRASLDPRIVHSIFAQC